MATVYGTHITVQNLSPNGVEHPAPSGRGATTSQALTTSTSAQNLQRGGADWVMPSDGYLRIFTDGNVLVASGETAVRGTSAVGHRFDSNISGDSIWVAAGDVISVIDA